MSTLVIYYSRAGHTGKAAQKIQAATGADICEIKGDVNYGGYFKAIGIARKEYKDVALLNVTSEIPDMTAYDTVIVGFPIWYSKCPMLVISCLKSIDLAGKDVYPFCTSGLSGIDGAMEGFKAACEGANVHPGKRFSKSDDEASIKEWLKK